MKKDVWASGDFRDFNGERAAGAVIDNHRPAELLGERGRDDARDVVGGAARGLRHHQTNGSLRELRSDRPRSPESEK